MVTQPSPSANPVPATAAPPAMIQPRCFPSQPDDSDPEPWHIGQLAPCSTATGVSGLAETGVSRSVGTRACTKSTASITTLQAWIHQRSGGPFHRWKVKGGVSERRHKPKADP